MLLPKKNYFFFSINVKKKNGNPVIVDTWNEIEIDTWMIFINN